MRTRRQRQPNNHNHRHGGGLWSTVRNKFRNRTPTIGAENSSDMPIPIPPPSANTGIGCLESSYWKQTSYRRIVDIVTKLAQRVADEYKVLNITMFSYKRRFRSTYLTMATVTYTAKKGTAPIQVIESRVQHIRHSADIPAEMHSAFQMAAVKKQTVVLGVNIDAYSSVQDTTKARLLNTGIGTVVNGSQLLTGLAGMRGGGGGSSFFTESRYMTVFYCARAPPQREQRRPRSNSRQSRRGSRGSVRTV
jgi:hypothetical protein